MFFSFSLLPFLRRSLFGISSEETTFARRGFSRGDSRTQGTLEHIGALFVEGYHLALADDRMEVLVPALEELEAAYRGFAFEGAAMALSLLDYFSPFKRRLASFIRGPGAHHVYMLHVGAGWTLGRLPRSLQGLMGQFDPLLSWLVVDGYGFHQGFFSWPRFIAGQEMPAHLSAQAAQVFDQGLGRSLWFVKGADIARIHEAVFAFPAERRRDLWSGIGLACAYAGGIGQDEVQALCSAAGTARWHLAQGAAFAAKARQRAGNPAAHTDLACRIFSGLSSEEAAAVSDACLIDLPQGAYALWRARIRAQLAGQNERVEQG